MKEGEVDVFEHVQHALNGRGGFTQRGDVKLERFFSITKLQQTTWGLDSWIDRAYLHRRISAIECLALIYCALAAFEHDEDKQRKIVYGWADELSEAAVSGELEVRDSATNLRLVQTPEDWDWMVWLDDADRFVRWRGMNWSCSAVVEHLFKNRAAPGGTRVPFSPGFVASVSEVAPANLDEPPPSNKKSDAGIPWEDQVRAIADELDLRDAKSGAQSSKKDMADRVAIIAAERGIHGPYGQLTGTNILRHALQGNRWTRPRYRDTGLLRSPENPENSENPENAS